MRSSVVDLYQQKQETMSELRELYKTLSQRKRPEDVAELVLQILKGDLTKKEKSTLNMAAKRSLKKALYGYTSMAQEFASAIGAEKQMKKTIELFKLVPMDEFDANHAPDIQAFINAVAPIIHKSVGANNFVGDRSKSTSCSEVHTDPRIGTWSGSIQSVFGQCVEKAQILFR